MLVFACHLNFLFNKISSHVILHFIINSLVSFWVQKFSYHWYTYLITQAITFFLQIYSFHSFKNIFYWENILNFDEAQLINLI